MATEGGGWSRTVYTVTPGIPGDSGSGFLNASGQAIGTLSTVAIAPLAALERRRRPEPRAGLRARPQLVHRRAAGGRHGAVQRRTSWARSRAHAERRARRGRIRFAPCRSAIITLPGDGIGPEITAAAERSCWPRSATSSSRSTCSAARRSTPTAPRSPTRCSRPAAARTRCCWPPWAGRSGTPPTPRLRGPSRVCSGLRKGLGLFANLRPVRPSAGAARRQPAQARADRGHRPPGGARAHGRHLLRRLRTRGRPRPRRLRLHGRRRWSASPAWRSGRRVPGSRAWTRPT